MSSKPKSQSETKYFALAVTNSHLGVVGLVGGQLNTSGEMAKLQKVDYGLLCISSPPLSALPRAALL